MNELDTPNFLRDFSKEQLFELLINQLEGFVVSDELGRYVFVSQKWTELIGLTLEDEKGLYVHDVVPETRIDKVLKEGKPISGDFVKVRNTRGEELRLLCSYTPLYREGTLIGCFTVTSLRGMEQVMELTTKTEELLGKLNYYHRELAEIQGAKYSIGNIVGNSDKIQQLKVAIYRAARSSSTVMIQGETGAGKELVAHSIHSLSPRAAQPFIKINCAAIPSELLESELFGYASGAFTGANKNGKKGKFLLADNGTLFLDEINQMPLHLQPKLLRAIQEWEIEPVGSGETIPVNCRLIVASNAPLEKLVKARKFREDLFYRLNVVLLEVPPLRERKEDIPFIADYILEKLNAQLGMSVPGISEDAKAQLQEYEWPGNVRELQNVIERAMNESWLETLTWKHFEPYFRNQRVPVPTHSKTLLSIKQAKESAERQAIIAALDAADGSKTTAAKILGITRAMLYRKMERYGIRTDWFSQKGSL